jgi:hypothetical protein
MSSLYSINFATHASENPLSDGGNWTAINGTLQITGGACQPSPTAGGSGTSVLTGVTPTGTQQYAQFTIGTMTSNGTIPQVAVWLRSPSNGATINGTFRFIMKQNGTWALVEVVGGTAGTVASGNLISGPTSGDVFTLIANGNTVTAYQNGALLTTYTDPLAPNAFTNVVLNVNANGSTSTCPVLAFSMGTGNPLVYSQPDCRNFGHFPNSSRTVQGTSIYDVQTTSNIGGAPVDSRAAGAPVDSRVGGGPVNSRASGTFGPGE